MSLTRGWYWQVHGEDYKRVSVEAIDRFCGWPFLLKIVNECKNTEYRISPAWTPPNISSEKYQQFLIIRDQGIIATMFETGGRVSEVLALRKNNFEITNDWIRVVGMPVLKRHRKDKETGEIIKIPTTRGRFGIPRAEPLVPYMLRIIKMAKDYLFPSPKDGNEHLSSVRAYQIVRNIGERLGIHLWDHWFRAQRASQLASQYNYRLHELMEFFNWEDVKTAKRYARLATEDLERKMRPEIFAQMNTP
ncbi:MAG: tyrosine-type recombinase/integrase [Candidatus Hermodarchaeia archaeon]